MKIVASKFAATAMTTPSLGQVLAQEPAIAGIVDGMNELLPGVAANEENVKILLDSITKNESAGYITLFSSPDLRSGYAVTIRPFMLKKECMMAATVKGPMEEWTSESSGRQHPQGTRFALWQKDFPGTSDGVLDMLREVKTALHRYRLEGPCPKCRRDTTLESREPPMKRIKLRGFPYCLECSLKEICGCSEAQE